MRHESDCEPCAKFAWNTRKLESRLGDAMHVDVPGGLVARIKQLQRSRGHGFTTPRLTALAASVVIAIGIGGMLYLSSPSTSLHTSVTEHIKSEWGTVVAMERQEPKAISSVLSTIGGAFNDDSGDIRATSLCDLSEFGGAHLVIDGAKGPVLALVLKETYVDKARFMTMSEPEGTKIEGILTPIRRGSIAIVGLPGEDLEAVDRMVRRSVLWLL